MYISCNGYNVWVVQQSFVHFLVEEKRIWLISCSIDKNECVCVCECIMYVSEWRMEEKPSENSFGEPRKNIFDIL